MKIQKAHWAALSVVVPLLLSAALAADMPAVSLKFKNFTLPGARLSVPYGINNSNVISGFYEDQTGTYSCFMVKDGKMTLIAYPGAGTTLCYGINSNGAIVGQFTDPPPSTFGDGFLYENGQFTEIGPLGPNAGGAASYGINDNGDIVGLYSGSDSHRHGYLFDGTTYTTLDPPGATFTEANAINNSGLITLWSVDSNGQFQSYLYNGTTYQTLVVPGAVKTEVWGINNLGDIALTWLTSTGNHGAILHAGKYYTVNDPQGTETSILGINDSYTFVGIYSPDSGKTWPDFAGFVIQ